MLQSDIFLNVIKCKDRQVEMETSRTRPRSGHMTRQLVITIGGEIYNKNYLNSVDCYNVDRGQWTRLKELPFPRCHHGAALYESSIIYVAGVHPGHL